MIGMQEMVMQTHARPGEPGKIRLFPAWPEPWDVDFKLHAPYKTVVEATFKSGKVAQVNVTPQERQSDIILKDDNQ